MNELKNNKKSKRNKKYFIGGFAALATVATAGSTIGYVLLSKTEKHAKLTNNDWQMAAKNTIIYQALSAPKAGKSAVDYDKYYKDQTAASKNSTIKKAVKRLTDNMKIGLSTQAEKDQMEIDVKSWLGTDNAAIEEDAQNDRFFGGMNKKPKIYPYKMYNLVLPIKHQSVASKKIKIKVVYYISMAKGASGGYDAVQNGLLNQIKADLKSDKEGIYNLGVLKNTSHKLFTDIDELQLSLTKSLKKLHNVSILNKNISEQAKIITQINNIAKKLKSLRDALRQDFVQHQLRKVPYLRDFLKIFYNNQTAPKNLLTKLNFSIDDTSFNEALENTFKINKWEDISTNTQSSTKKYDVKTIISSLSNIKMKMVSSKEDELINVKINRSEMDSVFTFQYTDIKGKVSDKQEVEVNDTSKHPKFITFQIFKDHDHIAKRLNELMKGKLNLQARYKNLSQGIFLKDLYIKSISRIIHALKAIESNDINKQTDKPYELKYSIPYIDNVTKNKKNLEITSKSNVLDIVKTITQIDGKMSKKTDHIGQVIGKISKGINFELLGEFKADVSKSKTSSQKKQIVSIDLDNSIDSLVSHSASKGVKFEINLTLATKLVKQKIIEDVFNNHFADDQEMDEIKSGSTSSYENKELKDALVKGWNAAFNTKYTNSNIQIKNIKYTDFGVGSITEFDASLHDNAGILVYNFGHKVVTSKPHKYVFESSNKKVNIIKLKNIKLNKTYFKIKNETSANLDSLDRFKIFKVKLDNAGITYNNIWMILSKASQSKSSFYKELIKPLTNKKQILSYVANNPNSDSKDIDKDLQGIFVLDTWTGRLQLVALSRYKIKNIKANYLAGKNQNDNYFEVKITNKNAAHKTSKFKFKLDRDKSRRDPLEVNEFEII